MTKDKTKAKVPNRVLLTCGFLLSFAIPFCVLAARVEAAALYLSPSAGDFLVGDILSVNVLVDTQGVAINNAEAVINFPADLLEVISVNRTGSIFSLWVEEPSFSNSAGAVSFNGGLPTPGFNGSAGKIINIVFRIKKAGAASLIFASGAVRANDGYGTNVFSAGVSSQFNLVAAEKSVPVAPFLPQPVSGTPGAPLISSPTHPDSSKWYSKNAARFTWSVPAGISAVRLLYDKNPGSVPQINYEPAISEKDLLELKDGVYYLHAQFKNDKGWGAIAHFRFQIDTQPPKLFKIESKDGPQTFKPQPTLFFETSDELSGLDYYEVFVDGKSVIKTDKSEYMIPPQQPGRHSIMVKAVDRAGNETLAITEIEILPIEKPVITDYPKEMVPGNILAIKGTALPEATVRVFIGKENAEPKVGETKSNASGQWSFVEVQPLIKGTYQVWAETIDSYGAKSGSSEKVTVLVTPPIFLKIGELTLDYLTVIIILLALTLAAVSGSVWNYLKLSRKRKKLRKKITSSEKVLYQTLKTLQEKIEEQVAKLDGKPGLSEREKKICDNLKEILSASEKIVGREVKDIEKELN